MITYRLIDELNNDYYYGLIWNSKNELINFFRAMVLWRIHNLNSVYKIEESDASKNEIKKYNITEFLYNEYLS